MVSDTDAQGHRTDHELRRLEKLRFTQTLVRPSGSASPNLPFESYAFYGASPFRFRFAHDSRRKLADRED